MYRFDMAIMLPNLSPELLTELDRAGSLHAFVMKTFPGTFMPENDRVNMLAAKTQASC